MNSKIKEAWVNALRSGEYNQGSEKLRGADGYCCQGVLCDIYAKEHNREWDFRGYDEDGDETNLHPMDYWYFGDQSEFLPQSVMEWAELNSHNPQVKINVENDEEDPWYYIDEIANVNDSGYTFSQIADLIQVQL